MTIKEQLDNLFKPRSVALIGASSTFGKWGFNLLTLLLGDAGLSLGEATGP